MPPRPPVPRADPEPGPSLQIDDALISEALAAVERRAVKGPARRAPSDEPTRRSTGDTGDMGDGVDIDVEAASHPGAGGEITIESLSDDLIVQLEPIAAALASPDRGADAGGLFSIPEDLLEPPEEGHDADRRPSPAETPPETAEGYPTDDASDDERTDPRGFTPRVVPATQAAPPAPARPLTADPASLDRVSRLRNKCRALKTRLDQAEAALDQERQAHQLSRSRARVADLARQEAEEQRESLERFAGGLRNRILALEEEIARLQRRSAVEGSQSRQAAVEATVRGLLPVLDNLLLALLHAQTDIDRFVPGVQMVASQFRRCLERLGVQQVDASPGARFDPAHHEALLTLASTEIPEGHVITEVRPGYTLNARLLRAAQVSVAGGSVRHAERSLPPAADDTLPDATQPTDREE